MTRIAISPVLAAAGLIFVAGCGGSQGPAADTTPRTPPPAELVGVWRFTAVSPGGYTDPVTGKFWNASADSISMTFKPDGHFVDAALSTSALYDCHVSIFKMFEGTLVVRGEQLDVYFTHNTEHGEGNCPPQTYDKALPAETDHWTWKIVQQPAPDPPQLLLTDSATNAEVGRFDFQPGGQ